MERTLKIKYRWSEHDNPIEDDDIEILEEEAMDRIIPMIKEGYHSGQLIAEYDTEEGEKYFTGWWSVEKLNS